MLDSHTQHYLLCLRKYKQDNQILLLMLLFCCFITSVVWSYNVICKFDTNIICRAVAPSSWNTFIIYHSMICYTLVFIRDFICYTTYVHLYIVITFWFCLFSLSIFLLCLSSPLSLSLSVRL